MKHTGEFGYPAVEHSDISTPLDLLNDELRTSDKGDQFRQQTLVELHAIYKETPLAKRMAVFGTTLPTLTLHGGDISDTDHDSCDRLRPQAFYHGSLLAMRTCLTPLDSYVRQQILFYDAGNQIVYDITNDTEDGITALHQLASSFDSVEDVLEDQDDEYHFAILQAAEYAAHGLDSKIAQIYETDFTMGFTYAAGYMTSLQKVLLAAPPQKHWHRHKWFA